MSDAAEGFANSAKNGLTSKIGGVPFYIYGIGFVAAFWAYKHFVAAKAPTPVTQDLVRPTIGAASVPGAGVGPSSGVVTTGSSGGVNTSNTIPGQLDASTWVDQGTAYLAALGYDGTTANGALSSYVSGVQPTGTAQRLVNLVLGRYGSPQSTQLLQVGNTLNSPTLVRVIKRPDNDAIFGQYSDGSLHWFTDPNDLYQTTKSTGDPNVFDPATNSPKVVSVSANDPIWNNAGVKVNNNSPFTPSPVS